MGQWTGRYHGADNGELTLELDEGAEQWLGQATLRSDNPRFPALLAGFAAPAKGEIAFRTPWIAPLNPATGVPEPWEQLHRHFSADVRIPLYADVRGARRRNRLTLAWTTNLGSEVRCELVRSGAPQGWWARLLARLGR